MFLSLLIGLTLTPSISEVDSVRISLGSLFNPTEVRITVLDGSEAILEVAGRRVPLRPSQSLKVTLPRGSGLLRLESAHSRDNIPGSATDVRLLHSDSAIELVIPGKWRRVVSGDLSVTRSRSNNSLQIVLTADFESAVASIVAAEMSGVKAVEALKALAITARTYMLAHRDRHRAEGFDFCDTTHCQFYRGEDNWMDRLPPPAIREAVTATRREWLGYRGSIVETYYTAACGGMTATPDSVWGGETKSPYRFRRVRCEWCQKSTYFRWRRSAGADLICAALSPVVGFRLGDGAELAVKAEKRDGLVDYVLVREGKRERRLEVDLFRRAIGRRLGWNTVRSPTFTIERRGPAFIFSGRGFGSQVGLCVAGAVAQASKARTHVEILSYYFPETQIVGHP